MFIDVIRTEERLPIQGRSPSESKRVSDALEAERGGKSREGWDGKVQYQVGKYETERWEDVCRRRRDFVD